MLLEVFVTFEERPQCAISLEFAEPPSEAEALFQCLSRFSQEERQDLVKLSFCQLNVMQAGDALAWLNATEGKYYFADNRTLDQKVINPQQRF